MRYWRIARVGIVSIGLGLLWSCAGSQTVHSVSDLPELVGRTVTVEGVAKATRLGGPTVDFDGGYVLASRPVQFEAYVGRPVRVTGKLVEVPDPLVEPRAGMERPKTYMLQDARWVVRERQ